MAAPWKRIETEEEIDDLVVSLPAMFGVPPEKYLPAILGALLVGIFFLAFVLPGIISYGTVVTIRTAPAGAAVYIDGSRVGASPIEEFFPAGEHTLEVRYPGLQPYSETIDLSGRLIGSWLVPRRETFEIAIDTALAQTQIEQLLNDFHEWALSGPPGAQFQHPPLARTIARAFWAVGSTEIPNIQTEEEIAIASLVSGAQKSQVPDLLGALLRITGRGGVLTTAQLQEVVQLFVQLDNSSPGFAAVVADWAAGEPEESILSDSSWILARQEALSTALLAASLEMDERSIPVAQTITLDSRAFALVPPGNYILGYPAREESGMGLPVTLTEVTYLLEHEVTNGEYARFLEDMPDWERDNLEALVAQDLVDERYLLDWPEDWGSAGRNSAWASLPVRYVSWFAASAYAGWLEERLISTTVPGIGGRLRVSLPRTDLWEYAAFLNALGPAKVVSETIGPAPGGSATPGALGLRNMQGNLWEWTADWYTANRRVLAAPVAAQRAVIGGSYANPQLSAGTVGAQPPSWCTPFLGFRVAIGSTDSVMEGRIVE